MSTASDSVWGELTPRVRRRLIADRWINLLLPLLFLIVVLPLLDLIYWIASRALPTMTLATITTNPEGLSGGLFAPIVGTFEIILIATLIAGTLGILAGMYTAEFAPRRIAAIGRMGGSLLAGVPAIVIGYFGYFALVLYAHWGVTLLTGAVTLSIFMLPYVYRTTDLAFQAVPSDQRSAALGMGATPAQYLRRVGWPIAFPRILTGVFIAMAIGLGETAPLLFTAGWNTHPAQGLSDPTSYLTGLIWLYYSAPTDFGTELALAFQAAFLLIVIVIVLNIVVQIVAERYRRRLRGLFR
ncbi:MAG: PstA family ABC transporter permease [Thermoplasmata archaeon]